MQRSNPNCKVCRNLYIPIWLYSNGNTSNDDKFNRNFTFQSGYIQIDGKDCYISADETLHSNLVIFKY